MTKINRIDKFIGIVIELFTSKTIIIVIMVSFMGGIIDHLYNIFDSWLLALGAQATVLLLSVNAKYLPSIKTKSGADIPVLALLVALCISYLLYMDLQKHDQGEIFSDIWWLTIVKSIFISALELSYSFLFVARTKDSDFDVNNESVGEALNRIEQDENTKRNNEIRDSIQKSNVSTKIHEPQEISRPDGLSIAFDVPDLGEPDLDEPLYQRTPMIREQPSKETLDRVHEELEQALKIDRETSKITSIIDTFKKPTLKH